MTRSLEFPNPRWLLAIVFFGWLLRAIGLLGHGVLIDYDEGVHYAAASMLANGYQPYRDFIFVHPPGIVCLLLPLAILEPHPGAFLDGARWVVTGLGALNIALLARLGNRLAGPRAGLAAALAYAVYPEAVAAERMLMLQPLLNTLVLLALNSRARWLSALWGGQALLVKSWALLLWIVLIPRWRGWTLLAVVVTAACLIPWWTPQFSAQTLDFHLHRPVQESGSLLIRCGRLLQWPHLAITLLALYGLVRHREKAHREIAALWACIALAFFWAPSHFSHYNAYLAIPESFFAGVALAAIPTRRRPLAALVLSTTLIFIALYLKERNGASDHHLAQIVQQHVPAQDSVFSMNPGSLLRCGRLPAPPCDGAPLVLDSYAFLLSHADSGQANVDRALQSVSAQKALRPRLDHSQWILVDRRFTQQADPNWAKKYLQPVQETLWRHRESK